MDPNCREPIASRIARRPERLNILITGATGHIREPRAHHAVCVRYGWSPLPADAGLDRPVAIGVPLLADRWDPSVLNRIGQPGAFVETPNPDGIRAAVAKLRAVWGALHVQDNSGLVPDLHQGMWRG
jgi:hypothetical protein